MSLEFVEIFVATLFYGLSLLVIFLILILLFRKWMQGRKFTKNTRIDGKVVIITGANSGIGKETAIDLARRGGKIYIACRDTVKGENALREIRTRSESVNVHLLQLDLASMNSVRQFSEKFHELEQQLHILINNAGVMASPKTITEDGFELHFATNHLGHFLLTNLLMDLLKKSAPSRVVVVSSLMHIIGRIRKHDLFGERFYFSWFAYASSKLANILFTRKLSTMLKDTGVTVNCLHPGIVESELVRHVNSKLISTIAGAQTQICLAVNPDLETTTGKYFSDCRESWTLWTARNHDMADWLWKKSEELTGLQSSQ